MKIHKYASTIILTSGLLVFTLSGCNHSSTYYNTPTDNNDTELVKSEVSSTKISIGSIVSDLVKAAGGKIGSDVFGFIMQLLGYGDSENQEEIKYLNQMSSKLDQIEVELGVIQSELNTTIKDLGLSHDETVLAIMDPHTSVSTITAKAQHLEDFIGPNPTPGSTDKDMLHDFAEPLVNSEASMDVQIQFINDAILPKTIEDDAVFRILTHKSFDQYENKSKSIVDAYNALEHYASTLIYAEVKAANLYVEATTYLYKKYQTTIENFMNRVQTDLKNQIGNYNATSKMNQNSFIYNAWGLALWTMNPLPYKEGADYFSTKPQQFLKRADVYRMSTLNKNFSGLRMLFFVTGDISSDNIPKTLTVVHMESEKTYQLNCEQVTDNIQSYYVDSGNNQVMGLKEYDYWYEGNKVDANTTYSAYFCETNTTETGHYTIKLDPTLFEATHLPEIEVAKYDENYTKTSDGNITYGFAASVLRTPMNRYTEDSPFLGSQKMTYEVINFSISGDEHNWPFAIENTTIESENNYYNGGMEIDAYFNYQGQNNKKIYVDYGATFSGYNYNDDQGFTYSQGQSIMQIGVWDLTGKKYACKKHYNKIYYTDKERKDFKFTPTGVCSFNAEKGHGYYVYFFTQINGQDLGDNNHLQLDSIDYVHIHF